MPCFCLPDNIWEVNVRKCRMCIHYSGEINEYNLHHQIIPMIQDSHQSQGWIWFSPQLCHHRAQVALAT